MSESVSDQGRQRAARAAKKTRPVEKELAQSDLHSMRKVSKAIRKYHIP